MTFDPNKSDAFDLVFYNNLCDIELIDYGDSQGKAAIQFQFQDNAAEVGALIINLSDAMIDQWLTTLQKAKDSRPAGGTDWKHLSPFSKKEFKRKET